MQVELDGKIYDVEIIKKSNKNIYIRVKDGKIVATCNYLASKNSILKLIMDNKKSIIKMLDKDSKKNDRNENFYYFGKCYDVIYGLSDIEFSGNKLYAPSKMKLDKYIKKEILRIYEDRLDYWYNRFTENIPEPSLRIRKMTSRWGVCNTASHVITLNYNLSKYDITCLDYVIVHELSHLIYPNHQEGFWRLVGKYYPKYKEARKMLKE
jgi:predicted metal-dependent hydrolase